MYKYICYYNILTSVWYTYIKYSHNRLLYIYFKCRLHKYAKGRSGISIYSRLLTITRIDFFPMRDIIFPISSFIDPFYHILNIRPMGTKCWNFGDNLVRRQRPPVLWLNDVAWIRCGRCLLPLFLSFLTFLSPSLFLRRSPATPRIFGAWCRDQIGSTCCTNVKVEAVKELPRTAEDVAADS